MSNRLEVVTIDGPSGVGKSTISRKLAARLGFTYLDTGAMYRGVALKCRQSGVDIGDERAVADLMDILDLRLLSARSENEDVRVLLDGQNVSATIRTSEISMLASAVSAQRPVREKLTRMQQKMGAAGRIVAEGRDTGTMVFPGAAWKFYLDAGLAERVRRRTRQLRHRGEAVDEKEIYNQIVKRDRDDMERSLAPLKAAPDAVRIDSTDLSPDNVLAMMLAVIHRKPLKDMFNMT